MYLKSFFLAFNEKFFAILSFWRSIWCSQILHLHIVRYKIIKSNNILIFKVYHIAINKNDYIHFYSHHNNKIKKGLIISFYLRAVRICSLQYLDEEFEYIEHSLKSLKYPKFFILNARKKALKIHSSNPPPQKNTISSKTNDNRNTLFSHMLEFKHTFTFPQATPIQYNTNLQWI